MRPLETTLDIDTKAGIRSRKKFLPLRSLAKRIVNPKPAYNAYQTQKAKQNIPPSPLEEEYVEMLQKNFRAPHLTERLILLASPSSSFIDWLTSGDVYPFRQFKKMLLFHYGSLSHSCDRLFAILETGRQANVTSG